MRDALRDVGASRRRYRAAFFAALIAVLALLPTSGVAACAAAPAAQAATAQIATVAGAAAPVFPNAGLFSGDGGAAVSAALNRPSQVAVWPRGGYLFTDSMNHRIRRVDATGRISTVAGNGLQAYCGDGHPATRACLNAPHSVVAGRAGSFYIADTFNHRVRRVDAAGRITTVAGNGLECRRELSTCGEGGPATRASISHPVSVNPTADGGLLIGDSSTHRVLMVTSAGKLLRVAGTGRKGFSGDGGLATNAKLNTVADAIAYADGFLIADGANCRVRYVDRRGRIHPFAGSTPPATCETWIVSFANPIPPRLFRDGGPAARANIMVPGYLAVAGHAAFIVDFLGNRIRRVRGGRIDTVAGTGEAVGFAGDGGDPRQARLAWPSGVAAIDERTLLITDSGNNRIRHVTLAD